MATLTYDKHRVIEHRYRRNALPVIASDTIYGGAAVGDNGSGYARPLVAADPFLGFAICKADNSAGAAGAVKVELFTEGVIELSVAGVTGVGDVGDAVYASDDDTFTKTSTSNTKIGKILRFESGTKCMVQFDAFNQT